MSRFGVNIVSMVQLWTHHEERRNYQLRAYVSALWKNSKLEILALTDQAVVSATSFLTSWMIGRFAGANQLGAYAIGVSVLSSIYTIQGSLIAAPYSVQRHRTSESQAEYAGSTLVLSGILSTLIGLLLVIFALALVVSGAFLDWLAAIFSIAAIVPFAVSRDFIRRFAFTHLQMTNALLLDSCVAVVQLLVLASLNAIGMLSTATAFVAIGLSCAIATILSLYQIRSEFLIRLGHIREAIRQSWTLGKWLVIAQVMISVQAFITYWISLLIAGTTATGIYAACMTIVSVSNPVVNGLSNLFLPRSVLAWKENGGIGLRRKAVQDCILLAAVMAPFCFVIALTGESLLHLLYPATEYAGHGRTAAVLAFATLAFALGWPASSALASMEKPKSIFVINTFGALLAVFLVFLLTVQHGILGAAYGWLLSNTVLSACLWFQLLVLVSRSVDVQDPIRVPRDVGSREKVADASSIFCG